MIRPIVILAPGAGMGHLVRASAVALALEKKGYPVVIVTSAYWAEAIGRITRVETVYIPPKHWRHSTGPCLKKLNPRVVVQDTFPFGFRGEEPQSILPDVPYVYLARVLNETACSGPMNDAKQFRYPGRTTIVITEPLTAPHQSLIEASGCHVKRLNQRIAFPFDAYTQPIPEKLNAQLKSEPVHLVVHSGPETETEQLIHLAKNDIEKAGRGRLAVINPFLYRKAFNGSWDYFPAAVLYKEAVQIYSGGGYNSVAEQIPFRKKVTYIPFKRTYDDQAFRISTLSGDDDGRQQGASETADTIASIYD